MQPGVREVWARAAWLAIDTTRAAGFPVQALFAGMPFDERSLHAKARVPWDHYLLIVERMGALAGGPERLEALLESTYHKVMPEVRSLAGVAVTPRRLIRFLFEVVDPFVFPMVTFRVTSLDADRLRIDTRLQPGYRPCELWFAASRGAIRSATRHLDLPPVELLGADVGPMHGVYDVRLPEAPSFAERARRIPSAVRKLVLRIALGATPDGAPLTVELDEAERDSLEARTAEAAAAWNLGGEEAELLRLVIEGHTDRAIATTLHAPLDAIEARVAALAHKAGVTTRSQLIVTFWIRSS